MDGFLKEKIMIKNAKILAIGVIAVFLTAGGVFAQARNSAKDNDGQKAGTLKEFKLSPEQRNKLEVTRVEQQKKISRLWRSVREKETALRDLLASPDVTAEKAGPLTKELQSLRSRLIDAQVNAVLEIKKILTREQFAAYQQTAPDNKGNCASKDSCKACASKPNPPERSGPVVENSPGKELAQ